MLCFFLVLAGCNSPKTPPDQQLVSVQFLDLAEGPWFSDPSSGEVHHDRFFCADQTRHGLILDKGQTLEATLELGDQPELKLTGCLRTRSAGARRQASLQIEVVPLDPGGTNAAPKVAAVTATKATWWGETLDLREFAQQRVRLRLSTDLGDQQTLNLRDVFVRHVEEVAAKAEPSDPPALVGAPKRILLISIDTWRANLGEPLGGELPMPELERWLDDSELFTPHRAAAGWTKPSHASLLSGVLPSRHGITRPADVLPEELVTLAESLQSSGFSTEALVYDMPFMAPESGLAQGFDHYQVLERDMNVAVRALVNLLAADRSGDQFVFFHTFEPHSDYTHLPYEGPGALRRELTRRFGVDRRYGCTGEFCASQRLSMIHDGQISPPEGEAEVLRFTYERGLVEVDHHLGVLRRALVESGLWDALLIVLTTDHGESLLEHGEVLHGNPWEEVLEIPLLIKWPGQERAGTKTTIPTSAIQIAPTLLDWAGLDVSHLPGEPIRGGSATPSDVNRVFQFSGTLVPIVWDGDQKAICRGQDPTQTGSLFDLSQDKAEAQDLKANRVTEISRLCGAAFARFEADKALLEAARTLGDDETQMLDEEETKRLEALGYIQ